MQAQRRKKLVAPDGGWGWMVCLGSGLITLSLRSLDPSFGLLFGDLLHTLSVDTTGASFIMSILDTSVNLSGMLVGPLTKKFGIRKTAIWGSLLSCVGRILTSQANSVAYIICTYSILGGLGTGFATAVAFVSLNNYFQKKRTQAVGLSMAATSLGMMVMPQVVNLLLTYYEFRGACLILGGLALHAVVGSVLLQPVAWHMVPAPCDEELQLEANKAPQEDDALLQKRRNDVAKNKLETVERMNSGEMSSVDLSQSAKDSHGKDRKSVEEPKVTSFFQKIVTLFDLDLLKDPVYVNVTVGLSLFYVAELNFKMITPFFLQSIGMPKSDVAFCLSLTAFADVVSRLVMPTIFTKLKVKNRTAFWITCILLGFSRSAMAEQSPGYFLMATLIVNGFLRGIMMANFNLCVSENCNLEKLPAALGMMMASKALFVTIFGPLIGYVRDATGSYSTCIHVMTGFIALCSLAWTIEFVGNKLREHKN